jgi:poly(3-hydroxybutyrate) depolymerase
MNRLALAAAVLGALAACSGGDAGPASVSTSNGQPAATSDSAPKAPSASGAGTAAAKSDAGAAMRTNPTKSTQAGNAAQSGMPLATAGSTGTNAVAGSSGNTAPPSAAAGSSGSAAGAGMGGTSASESERPSMSEGCAQASALEVGQSSGMLESGGLMREYLLYVPSSYTGKTPVPILFAWHSLSATAQTGLSYGYNAIADREGFIIVAPQGVDNAWNVGPCCTPSRDVDDIQYMRDLYAKFSKEACLDPKRIYGAGHSMGGGMSQYIACLAGDLFAAVAPSAFDLCGDDVAAMCTLHQAIGVKAYRTTNDIVPYNGGTITPSTHPYPCPIIGAKENLEVNARVADCMGDPEESTNNAGNACLTYKNCKDGVEVELCTGMNSHSPGNVNDNWEFLSRHHKL